MAFRQPTYHAPQRIYPAVEDTQHDASSNQLLQQLEESQEWVLFSPTAASATNRTYTTSTDRTRRTTGRSRISDYGSLDTAARSLGYAETTSDQTEGALEDEEDAELDSLDSHLHEFRAEPSVYAQSTQEPLNNNGGTVLPTHDGLGSFRLDRTMMGDGVQEHLYAFERYNPRRVKRRRESLELGQMELETDRTIDYERTRRIEEWRLEQSRALLDEIQRETRRRRESITSDRRSTIQDREEAEIATLGDMSEDISRHSNTDAKDGESEGFWSRITRRVIQDLMGIDDGLLSIIFGESLVEDDDLSTTHLANSSAMETALVHDVGEDTWEYRLLERVAKELGLLINQLSEHPGAFSTYLQMQQATLPYAGLPIIPETAFDVPRERQLSATDTSTPEFQPTIPLATQPLNISVNASQVGHLDDNADIDATPRPNFPIHASMREEFSKEEWEKQLDIKMVFRYLRSRFTSHPPSSLDFLSEQSRLGATVTSQDSARAAARAARVRQHHPLVSRLKPVERRTFKVSVPQTSPIMHRRGSSSCASQNTRKSAKRSGSSRHYWDIGGSIGSGSVIASTGGMGSWGEV
jgi:hypothetical protein